MISLRQHGWRSEGQKLRFRRLTASLLCTAALLIVSGVAVQGTWVSQGSGESYELRGVWGTSSSNVFAVGTGGVILHYDGASWSRMSSRTTNDLEDVWGTGRNNIFAVGAEGTILHYNGTAWSPMQVESAALFLAVWGMGHTNVVAVGGATGGMGGLGVAFRYDGQSWSESKTTGGYSAVGVWGNARDGLFVIFTNGRLFLRFDGAEWATLPPIPANRPPTDIWGSSSANLFMVGGMGKGEIRHYDGAKWTRMDSGTLPVLESVWGIGSSDVFAVGVAGTILHYDGEVWSAMESGTEANLEAVWAASANCVFAVGEDGTILYYGGS